MFREGSGVTGPFVPPARHQALDGDIRFRAGAITRASELECQSRSTEMKVFPPISLKAKDRSRSLHASKNHVHENKRFSQENHVDCQTAETISFRISAPPQIVL